MSNTHPAAIGRLPACALLLCSMALPLHAAQPDRTTFEWDARLRYEHVDDAAFRMHADAATLRLRAGLRAAFGNGWHGLLDAEAIAATGHYNSTANGRGDRPQVVDPRGIELNQAWLGWKGDRGGVTLGRQRLLFDNQRWIGNVGWRQNEQTFDGGSIVSKAIRDTTLTYAYVDNVNRVFGPDDGTQAIWLGDWQSEIHLLNANYAGLPFGTLTGYGYLLDIEDADAQSSETWGLRFAGKQALGKTVGLLYSLEYAYQEDYGDNPVEYDAGYYLADVGLALPAAITVNVAQEVLEGDAQSPGKAFRTPLATLHKFQGWADMFLATPSAGIQDSYVGASIVVAGVTAQAVWHDFEAEDGGDSYGDELDLSLSRKFGQYVTGMLKYADYREDGFATDTQKFWLQVQLDF